MQCDNKECGKFRFLQYITDPEQVADVWTCDMNMAADPLHGSECFGSFFYHLVVSSNYYKIIRRDVIEYIYTKKTLIEQVDTRLREHPLMTSLFWVGR